MYRFFVPTSKYVCEREREYIYIYIFIDTDIIIDTSQSYQGFCPYQPPIHLYRLLRRKGSRRYSA